MNNLTPGEKKLLCMFLDELDEHMSNAGCNDLDKKYQDCLSKKEWIAVSKQYYEWNGDPKEHKDQYADCMMDFMVFYYLRRKAGLP